MKKFLMLLALGLLSAAAYPQGTKPNTKALKIGDTVPDISLGKIINYKTSTAKFSDFKGKLLILDFWASWCGPCIAAFPHLDSMQKKFSDKLVIMPVNTLSEDQNAETATNFFRKNEQIRLPSIVEDRTLSKLFPHRLIPHEVWIDGNGVVVAITDNNAVTESSINKILMLNEKPLVQKSDVLDWDMNLPLFYKRNGGNGDEEFISSSKLTKKLNGVPAYFTPYEDEQTKGNYYWFSANSANVMRLYWYAFDAGGGSLINSRRIFVEYDGSTYSLPSDSRKFQMVQGLNDSTYAYSLVFRKSIPRKKFFHGYMMAELNRSFELLGIQARIEKKVMPCLVLKRIKDSDTSMRTKGDKLQFLYAQGKGHSAHDTLLGVKNLPIADFIRFLGSSRRNMPFIVDETGIDFPIDLSFYWVTAKKGYGLNTEYDNNELIKLQQELRTNGLALQEAERLVDVLIINCNHKP